MDSGQADWLLYGGPVTDAELTELVELLEHAPEPGEPLEIDDWSVLAGAEFVIHWSGVDDDTTLVRRRRPRHTAPRHRCARHGFGRQVSSPGIGSSTWPDSPRSCTSSPTGPTLFGNQPRCLCRLRGRQRHRPATGDRPDDRARARRRRAPPASLVHAERHRRYESQNRRKASGQDDSDPQAEHPRLAGDCRPGRVLPLWSTAGSAGSSTKARC